MNILNYANDNFNNIATAMLVLTVLLAGAVYALYSWASVIKEKLLKEQMRTKKIQSSRALYILKLMALMVLICMALAGSILFMSIIVKLFFVNIILGFFGMVGAGWVLVWGIKKLDKGDYLILK